MELRFYHDSETDLPHIYNHGVTESEVEDVLRFPIEEAKSDRGARVAIGRTVGGRILKVIYRTDHISNGIFVITAYDLRGKAMMGFRRRMRRRRQ